MFASMRQIDKPDFPPLGERVERPEEIKRREQLRKEEEAKKKYIDDFNKVKDTVNQSIPGANKQEKLFVPPVGEMQLDTFLMQTCFIRPNLDRVLELQALNTKEWEMIIFTQAGPRLPVQLSNFCNFLKQTFPMATLIAVRNELETAKTIHLNHQRSARTIVVSYETLICAYYEG